MKTIIEHCVGVRDVSVFHFENDTKLPTRVQFLIQIKKKTKTTTATIMTYSGDHYPKRSSSGSTVKIFILVSILALGTGFYFLVTPANDSNTVTTASNDSSTVNAPAVTEEADDEPEQVCSMG